MNLSFLNQHPCRSLVRRTALGPALLTLATLVVAPFGHAQTAPGLTKAECAKAYEEGQNFKADGKLQSAHERLLRCGNPSCPTVINRDCLRWLQEVDAMIPSIVLGVRTPEGSDVATADLTVDGTRQALDGKPIQLEPGPHTILCQVPGYATYKETIIARAGERNRAFSITLQSLSGPAPASTANSSEIGAPGGSDTVAPATSGADRGAEPRGVQPVTYILAGVGVLGLVSTAYFGATGLSAAHELQDRGCKPTCPESEVSAARTKIVIANVSFGVGVVAIGASLWTYFASRPSGAPSRAAAVGVDVSPMQGGGVVGVRTRF